MCVCNYLLIIIITTITHLLSFSRVCASEKRGLEPAGLRWTFIFTALGYETEGPWETVSGTAAL